MKHVSTAILATVTFAMAAALANIGALRKSDRIPPDGRAAEAITVAPAPSNTPGLNTPELGAPIQVSTGASNAPAATASNTLEHIENNKLIQDSKTRSEVPGARTTADYRPFLPEGQEEDSKPQVPEQVIDPARTGHLPKALLTGARGAVRPAVRASGRTSWAPHRAYFGARQHPVRLARSAGADGAVHFTSERRLGFSGSFGGCYYSGYVTAAGYQIHKSC